MSLSGFHKFAAEAQIIQLIEINQSSSLFVHKSPGKYRFGDSSHKENKRRKLQEELDNYNSNYKNIKNNRNNILRNSNAEEQRKNSPIKSYTRKRSSRSIDSEAQNEKQTIPNNFSINQVDLNNSNAYNSNAYINNINNNKIQKSDVSVVFFYLCGLQNFDSSKQIRNHFDKNYGYNPNFENSLKGPSLDSKNLMKADKDLKPLKMNFALFLKSLGMLADRVYKDNPRAQALEMFFDSNLSWLFKKKNSEGTTLKKSYQEILMNMRRDDIVIILLITYLNSFTLL